jgi:MoaA/NifB/PqqE/SkfB family radical SAM enzyme
MMSDFHNKVKDYRKNWNREYLKLYDCLPLDTPWSMMIEPTNVCNFKCIFCPTGDQQLLKSINRPIGNISYSLFCKIVNDLSDFDKKIKVLNLVKDGEPLLNKNFTKMIRYAKEKCISEKIQTASNGSILDKKKAIELIESGLDIIKISIEHVTEEGYKNITKSPFSYETIRRNVQFLYNEKIKRNSNLIIHVKIIDIDLSDEEVNTFINDYESISDTINIDQVRGWSHSDKKSFMLGENPIYNMKSSERLKEKKYVPCHFIVCKSILMDLFPYVVLIGAGEQLLEMQEKSM